MSQTNDRLSLNPTVEEEDEEIDTEPPTTETTAPRNRISWPEVREGLPALMTHGIHHVEPSLRSLNCIADLRPA